MPAGLEGPLAELLRFDQARGQIFFKDYRMILLSAYSLGALRKELIETLGWERARGVMKRFGYAAGLADGLALQEHFPDATRSQWLEYGPLLHALEGVVKTTLSTPMAAEEAGFKRVEGQWENSYEAEQHLATFGRSEGPICWTLAGYASGHATAVVGRRTYLVETHCRGMGHDHCRYLADLDENLSAAYDPERRDYEAIHLPEVLSDLEQTISRQQRRLRASQKTISKLQAQLAQRRDGPLGESKAWLDALGLAERAAPVDSTVLVLGESGTGKELVARRIHQRSRRAAAEFVAVNCSALPETLQEAELFGYAKGAFTGATAAAKGLFEAADGGTLFLDEIGDLAPQAQTKLLRTLQEGEIRRIGETRVRKVDVRIIAATNRDLEELIAAGQFREDLFFRINVVAVELPPLRARDNDALLLAEHFARHFALRFDKKVKGLSAEARRAVAAYAWPGNVRELEHAVERGVILADGAAIAAGDLPQKVRQCLAASGRDESALRVGALRDELARLTDEGARLAKALDLAEGNRERAAQLLGISRTTLWRKMKQRGL